MTQPTDIRVYQASVEDLDLIVPLFDAYRQFYGQKSDPASARSFLLERLQQNQSVVFVAVASDGRGVGFTQLYPSFSSVFLARAFILNDLFVVAEERRTGTGVRLLAAAAQFGRSVGAIRLTLSTAIDNRAAQRLYSSQGWRKDTKYDVYSLSL